MTAKTPNFSFGSLFSGIGGIDLGLTRAGMQCMWQVEIDPWARRVLHKHWPDVSRFEDVREVGKKNLEKVDLIAGGFPCPPFSIAGKQRGESDDRNLWPEMFRVIGELRPRWVLFENVVGIIKLYIDTPLANLEASGYSWGAVVLPSCAFDAPHVRQRLFVVAYLDDGRCTQCDTKEWKVFESNEDYRWPSESGIRRVANGISRRLDRVGGLGNAVVPSVAEFIGRRILKVDECFRIEGEE